MPLSILHRFRNDPAVRHEFAGPVYLLGRGKDCDLMIPQGTVARRHLRLWKGDALEIEFYGAGQGAGPFRFHPVYMEDLGTTNGTHLNGSTVRGVQPLLAGDEIFLLADTWLTLEEHLEPETRARLVALASDPRTPSVVLLKLARIHDASVGAAVAGNPAISAGLLEAMSFAWPAQVRENPALRLHRLVAPERSSAPSERGREFLL